MSLNLVLECAAELGVAFSVVAGNLKLTGPLSAIHNVAAMAKPHKQELLKIVTGQTVGDVGHCDECRNDLLGLKTFDGYTNRVCPNCGKWFRCLKPKAKPMEKVRVASKDWSRYNKSGCRVLEHPTACPPNFLGVE